MNKLDIHSSKGKGLLHVQMGENEGKDSLCTWMHPSKTHPNHTRTLGTGVNGRILSCGDDGGPIRGEATESLFQGSHWMTSLEQGLLLLDWG